MTGLLLSSAAAQTGSFRDSARAERPTKPFTFEVVSIRPHQPGTNGSGRQYLPDGFQGTWNIQSLIALAYTPNSGFAGSSSKVLNAPTWAYTDFYDFQARVSQSDQLAWQKVQDVYKSDLLRSGLQAALQDRTKLAVHVTSVEQSCLNLVVGKQIRNLKATVPGAVKPIPGKTWKLGDGFYIQEDGKRRFVGVSMEDLALLLTRLNNGHLVQDRTGLTGRYDFSLPLDDSPDEDGAPPIHPLDRMPISGVGLALKPGTAPYLTIYVDHIEKPDAN